MHKLIFLSFFLSFLASAASDKVICELAKKHSQYAISKIESFEIDLDGNNHKDIFITNSRGNAGAPYKVFLQKGKDYDFAGEVFIHPLAFQLVKNQSASVSSILAYIRDGADAGNFVTYEYSEKKYLRVKSERILSSDFEKRISPAKVSTSETICK